MSGWNRQNTSLQEVGGSLFRVMKVICRQQNTSYTADGEQNYECDTSAWKAKFSITFPQDWDVNCPTCVIVESVNIVGIPKRTISLPASSQQQPISFSIRSNALASAAVIEAHRFRGEIDQNGGVGAATPFSETSTDFIQTQKSNIIQIVPNTSLLDITADYYRDQSLIDNTYASYYFYKINWSQPVNLQSCGNILSSSVAATGVMDIMITADFDYPQQRAGAGRVFDARLLTAKTLNNNIFTAGGLQGGGYVGGSWNCVLVFYQLADSPK
jgi:hypothetical protein